MVFLIEIDFLRKNPETTELIFKTNFDPFLKTTTMNYVPQRGHASSL